MAVFASTLVARLAVAGPAAVSVAVMVARLGVLGGSEDLGRIQSTDLRGRNCGMVAQREPLCEVVHVVTDDRPAVERGVVRGDLRHRVTGAVFTVSRGGRVGGLRDDEHESDDPDSGGHAALK
jgi:hypothetical protein